MTITHNVIVSVLSDSMQLTEEIPVPYTASPPLPSDHCWPFCLSKLWSQLKSDKLPSTFLVYLLMDSSLIRESTAFEIFHTKQQKKGDYGAIKSHGCKQAWLASENILILNEIFLKQFFFSWHIIICDCVRSSWIRDSIYSVLQKVVLCPSWFVRIQERLVFKFCCMRAVSLYPCWWILRALAPADTLPALLTGWPSFTGKHTLRFALASYTIDVCITKQTGHCEAIPYLLIMLKGDFHGPEWNSGEMYALYCDIMIKGL